MERSWERKKGKSSRWLVWLVGGYIIAMTVLFYFHNDVTIFRKGMGGYWWAYLLPVALGFVGGLIMYFIQKHRGAVKSTQWFLSCVLGIVGMCFIGPAISLGLVIANDLSVAAITEGEYRIVSQETSHTKKRGTKYHIVMVDAEGNELSLTFNPGYADDFMRYSRVRLKVQEGCLGGRFIDVSSSDYGIFSGELIHATIE